MTPSPEIGRSLREGLTPLELVRSLRPGEQLRFHVDVGRCIGCNACMVACNEQHGNPSNLFWRRVGEYETGAYPDARRFFVSMACNHCLEPACLQGCPAEAFVKDSVTGIVRHLDEACIGCQYCVWNCPYSVPAYDPARHIVTKCDMSAEEMANDQWPACVAVCPTNALAIEPVDTREWASHPEAGGLPGLPPVSLTLSTTRFTLPHSQNRPSTGPSASSGPHEALSLSKGSGRAAAGSNRANPVEEPLILSAVEGERQSKALAAIRMRAAPQHAHLSLVAFTVLTQMAVGAFVLLALAGVGNVGARSAPAVTPLAIALVSMGLAPLHLGRPLRAYRAVLNWRQSWLSREIIAFGGFVCAAAASFGFKALGVATPAGVFEWAAITLGLVGLYCTARIYRVPARPAWNSPRTTTLFLLTSLLLGSVGQTLLRELFGSNLPFSTALSLAGQPLTIGTAVGILLLEAICLLRSRGDSRREIRASLSLLLGPFLNLFVLRVVLLSVGGILLPLGGQLSIWISSVSLGMCLASALVERYLFFTTVVPMDIPGSFPGTPFARR